MEYVGPANASLTLIHLRDRHHVSREFCKLEGIGFDENLAIVSKVQDDELAIARYLIRTHGLTEVYCEGLSDEADLQVRLDLLRTLAAADKLGALDEDGRRMQHELKHEVGIPGRLLSAGEIAKVQPVEDADALKAAGPGAQPSQIETRRRAIVAQLPRSGMALRVLGGSHDLRPYLGEVLHVRVMPKSFPGE